MIHLLQPGVGAIGWPNVATNCRRPKDDLIICRLTALLTEIVGNVTVTVFAKLILKGLDLRVDTRERDPSEVGEVFAYRHVKGVWSVEHVRIRLQVSSPSGA